SRWQGVELGRLVEEELAPFTSGQAAQVKVSGPPVSLLPATAQSLAVALHELATNAAKYGALSGPHGHVPVVWEPGPTMVVLHWIEKGGPGVPAPAHSGFGIKVITGSIEHQLGGRAEFDWGPDGLSCSLSIPRHQFRTSRQAAGARPEAEVVDAAL